MPDDDQDILLDWGLALSAAREPQRHGDRQERADRGKRRRSPSATITRRGAPGAQLLAFPAGRRVGEIRRLAEYMRRLSCEGARRICGCSCASRPRRFGAAAFRTIRSLDK